MYYYRGEKAAHKEMNNIFNAVLSYNKGEEFLSIGEYKTLNINLKDFDQVAYYHALSTHSIQKKLFILCGFTLNVAAFLPIIAGLVDKGYEIVVICYPGDFGSPLKKGLSEKALAYRFSLDGISEYCQAVIHAIGWDNYDIVAHSLGGGIAFHMLNHWQIPTQPQGLYLISPFVSYHPLKWRYCGKILQFTSIYMFEKLMQWLSTCDLYNRYFQLPLIRNLSPMVRKMALGLSSNNKCMKVNIDLATSSIENILASVFFMGEYCLADLVNSSAYENAMPVLLENMKFRCIIGLKDNATTKLIANREKRIIDSSLAHVFDENSYYPYLISRFVKEIWQQPNATLVKCDGMFSLEPARQAIDHRFLLIKDAGHEMWLESDKHLSYVIDMVSTFV